MTKQPNPPGPQWERLAFADLHVNAATLERACRVLRTVGTLASSWTQATKRAVPIVMTGDFWDARGILATKQIDAVLNELDIWQRAGVFGIFIPGNHDQVTKAGRIHGMRIFDPFPNIMVVTERILDRQNRIAYIPWREDPQDQGAQFILDSPNTWTVFGHAEVKGAVANNGHVIPGRVSLTQIHSVARACYLGHFHKRQRLGDRTYYLGNPFELNMGERGDPKGVAFITNEAVEPQWIDFADFPKHHRIDLRAPVEMPPLKGDDVLELVATKAQLRDPEIQKWVESLPVQDIRPRPVGVLEDDNVPPIAMDIEVAIEAYADTPERQMMGMKLFEEVKHSVDLPEPVGTECRVLGVEGRNFCKLRSFSMTLDAQGAVMVRGRQGSGKTALVDAISWCLFDQTSPRKPAGESASLRGDEVIRDDADEVVVTVPLRVDEDVYQVTRKKKRGKGSRVRVKGPLPRPEDIGGDDEWVRQLVGVPYALWRACVSLGQGSVANWLTGTDKARKALLSDALGLGACIPARKLTKKRLSAVEARQGALETRAASLQSVIQHMQSQDFSADAAKWDADRQARRHAAAEKIDACEDAILKADRGLAQYDDIAAQQEELEDDIIKLERRLAEGPGGEKRRAELVESIGAAKGELATVERDIAHLQAELSTLVGSAQGKGYGICPTCNQKWERAGVDRHASEIETKIKGKRMDGQNLVQRISNGEMELAGLQGSAAGQREEVLSALSELRADKEKVDKTKALLDRVKAEREQAVLAKSQAETTVAELDSGENPFKARADAHEAELAEKGEELEHLVDEIREEHDEAELLRFWVDGFGQNGVPVVVMRSVVGDLEATTNEFLGQLTQGRIWAELGLKGDALDVLFREYDAETLTWRERRLEQLSGGQRRCAEIAFSPFGLSEMLFRRLRCRVPLMIIDELTSHLGQVEKGLACDVIHALDRETVVVIDHDPTVQGEFDVVYDLVDSKLTRTK